MALRSLHAEINLRDHASGGLQGIDSSIDGIRDGLVDTQDEVSALSNETSEFGHVAGKEIQGVGRETDELEHKTRGFGDRMRSVGDTVSRNWTAIAAGVGAAGVAIEAAIRRNQELELQTSQVAIAMGTETDAIRDMIGGMTDYTFGTRDALAGAARLIRSGYDQQDQMEQLLPLFDSFSDATGMDMVQAIDLFDKAFSALDIPLTQAGDHLDTFTWLMTRTTVGAREFGQLMRREAPAMREMEMSVEDAALAMASLEAEGRRGPRAVMGFQDAIREAEGDVESFWRELGVSNDTLEEQARRLADADGLTQTLADAYAGNFTWLQKQQSALEELNYEYGDVISSLDYLSPLLTGSATLMGVLAGAKYLLAGATGIAAKALLGLTIGILGVTAPLWLIVAAVVAVGAAFWYFWDDVVALWGLLSDVGKWMYDAGASVVEGFVGGIISGYDWIRDAVTGIADTVTGGIKGIFGIKSPSALMWEFGVNMGEGLHLGLEEESKGFFSDARRMFSPEREPAAAMGGAGAYAPTVNITVNGTGRDAEGIAGTIDRRLRQTFSTHAERYFSRQRRKR